MHTYRTTQLCTHKHTHSYIHTITQVYDFMDVYCRPQKYIINIVALLLATCSSSKIYSEDILIFDNPQNIYPQR